MLKRVAAHWLVVGEDDVLPCAGVALDDRGVVCEVFSLSDAAFEPANTTFVDGFIAPFFEDVSSADPSGLKQFLCNKAAQLGVTISIGSAVSLFNYFVSESGMVVVTPLSGLFMNKNSI